MPTWSKSPPELVETFEAVLPGPPAVMRKMFGYPAAFVNGHMFMGLHEHRFILRLPEDERSALLALEGAEVFEPMGGRPMREYVAVPPTLLADPAALEPWVEKARAYAGSPPPKAPKGPRTQGAKPAVPPMPKAPGTRRSPAAGMPARRSPGRKGPSRGG